MEAGYDFSVDDGHGERLVQATAQLLSDASSGDTAEAIEAILSMVREETGVNRAAIFLLNESRDAFVRAFGCRQIPDDFASRMVSATLAYPDLSMAMGYLARNRHVVLGNHSSQFCFFGQTDTNLGDSSALLVPMVRDRTVHGFVLFTSSSGDSFWTDRLVALLGVVSSILARSLLRLKRSTLRQEVVTELRQQKLVSLGLLSSGLAHEINNPGAYVTSNLRTLRGYVDSLLGIIDEYREAIAGHCRQLAEIGLEQEAAVPRLMELVELTERRSGLGMLREDASTLLDETLDGMSRIHSVVSALQRYAATADSAFSTIRMNDLVDMAVDMVWGRLDCRGTIRKEYRAHVTVEVRESDILHVLVQLLKNAAHAVDSGGTITISTVERDEGVLVIVDDDADTEAGSSMPRVFAPFMGSSDRDTGMAHNAVAGLSIAHYVLNDHHGQLHFTSRDNTGSRFTLYLPRRQKSAMVAC